MGKSPKANQLGGKFAPKVKILKSLFFIKGKNFDLISVLYGCPANGDVGRGEEIEK